MKINDTLSDGAITLARDAAAAILGIYDSAFAVEHKADASPLTAADLAAHRILVEGLERLTPDIPVLSEEAAEDATWNVRADWRRLWLVTPPYRPSMKCGCAQCRAPSCARAHTPFSKLPARAGRR